VWPAVLAADLPAADSARAQESAEARFDIKPVEGPSWLKRLGLPRQKTAMGQMGHTGAGRSPAGSSSWGQSSFPQALGRPFTITGADLYRMSCESCHGAGGTGAPPEIRSLVRATSSGRRAARAEASLRERLHNGGQRMPPFRHLRRSEVDALLAYLRGLAGVPGAGTQVRLTEPVARVGEHVVKGTCFICHDATGPGRDAMATSPGLMPSLASFLDQPVNFVVRKVREGAPAAGMIGLRGEMPVYPYLTAEEVKAAYIYLMTYPPAPSAR
jgi:mono/diheme cytochrome c family protein